MHERNGAQVRKVTARLFEIGCREIDPFRPDDGVSKANLAQKTTGAAGDIKEFDRALVFPFMKAASGLNAERRIAPATP